MSDFKKYVGFSDMSPELPDFSSASGSYIYDTSGNRYLDFCTSKGSIALGHGNRVVSNMASWQMSNKPNSKDYGASDLSPISQYAKSLALHLYDLRPGYDRQVVFSDPGLASMDFALKAALDYTKKKGFVFLRGSSHVGGHGSFQVAQEDSGSPMSLQGEVQFLEPFALDAEDEMENIEWSDVAAVVIELVQTSEGIRAIPSEFLSALQDKCRESKTLLVVDESITGFGRTGRMFAQETYGFHSNITILGGAGGGGLPFGAVVASKDIIESVNPAGLPVSSFSGSSVVCSAGLAMLTQMTDSVLKDSRASSEKLKKNLEELASDHPAIVKEVSGEGMAFSIHFQEGHRPKDFRVKSCQEGVVSYHEWSCDRDDHIKLFPPVTLSLEEVEEASASIGEVLAEMEKSG